MNDKTLLRKQYEATKKARQAETNLLKWRQLFEEERTLRIKCELPHPNGGCYTCGKPAPVESDLWPFCSEPCHKRWTALNKYHERSVQGSSDLDIRKRQARALEIAAEKRAAKGVYGKSNH